LAYDDDHKAVDEAKEGSVYIHKNHYLIVPGLTSNHLEDSQD